jgi:hypothetical protein
MFRRKTYWDTYKEHLKLCRENGIPPLPPPTPYAGISKRELKEYHEGKSEAHRLYADGLKFNN